LSHKTVHLRGSEGPCKDITGTDAWETKSVEHNPSASNEIYRVMQPEGSLTSLPCP